MPEKKDLIKNKDSPRGRSPLVSIRIDPATLSAIDKIADRESLSRGAVIKRYIDKGLALTSYDDNLAVMTQAIRSEIDAYMENRMSKHIERMIKVFMKSAKLSAAQYYLLLRLLIEELPKDINMEGFVHDAAKAGMNYLKFKDLAASEYLKDAAAAIDAAAELGGA